jgi:prepilin-type N-terminal cleavage/methylation domain-containing protein
MTRPANRSSGFTLLELAMVLFIVSLLIGGLLLPLSAQNEIRGRQETDKALANIREALIGFAVVNGRLPCPAVASIPTGTTVSGLDAGKEATTPANANGPCACATSATSGVAGIVGAGAVECASSADTHSVGGVLPWATLGLPETDAWGHRYTYRIATQFARLATGQTTFGSCTPPAAVQNAAFALCSNGAITVSTAAAAGITVAGNVPVIVVSHGKNGLGATSPSGVVEVTATAADEVENADNNTTFVGNVNIDDQLAWVPSSVLMARMLAAGRLP